eukprot:augustus_masked-scaffold_1-processed-gene-21.3-mRNA-1 protein AED:0.16 eAED:0.17 QI:0/-1/0/1/-1/1/1/0/512
MKLVDPTKSGVHPELKISVEYKQKAQYENFFWGWILQLLCIEGSDKVGLEEVKALLESFNVSSGQLTAYIDNNFVGSSAKVDEVSTLIPSFVNIWDLISNEHFSSCILCNKTLAQASKSKEEEHESDPYWERRHKMLHFVSCVEKISTGDVFYINQFHTQENASRGWLSKLEGYLFKGRLALGNNNGYIIVVDRETGQLIEERIPFYIRYYLRLVYQTKLRYRLNSDTQSRTQKVFRSFTKRIEKAYEDKSFDKHGRRKCHKAIQKFIKFHNLDMGEVLESDLSFYTCFNEFFYRKLKPGARDPKDSIKQDKLILTSAADSRLAVFPTVALAQTIWIKGKKFSVPNLLGQELTDYLEKEKEVIKYDGLSVAVFRLAPQDYHRFHAPCSGVVRKVFEIDGALNTVNPIAVRADIDVFTDNKRTCIVLDTEEFGLMFYICVGAILVGSIILTVQEGERFVRGDEIGYFRFGGSTVILLFDKNRAKFDDDLLLNSGKKLETMVKVGQSVGRVSTS